MNTHMQPQPLSDFPLSWRAIVAIALTAAVLVAVCALHAGLGANVVAWRILVSFLSVASFQCSAAMMWGATQPPAAAHQTCAGPATPPGCAPE